MMLLGRRSYVEYRLAMKMAKALVKTVQKKGRAVLAVPGGRSVSGVFSALAQEPVPWKDIDVFFVDERLVSLDDKESNYRVFAASPLPKKFLQENIHPFMYEPTVADEGIRRYDRLLGEHGGKLDVVLLSAGENGHIAALHPHHSALQASTNFVALHDSPKPPKNRMTATPSLLLQSAYTFIVFFGEEKKEALTAFLDSKTGIADCPAKMIATLKNYVVGTDLEVGQ